MVLGRAALRKRVFHNSLAIRMTPLMSGMVWILYHSYGLVFGPLLTPGDLSLCGDYRFPFSSVSCLYSLFEDLHLLLSLVLIQPLATFAQAAPWS